MNSHDRFSSLTDWLEWQETLHPSSIDLGLQRVGRVADRLRCRVPAKLVISVAGTNGKGSSVAMLEAILLRAGYRVGCYTSPHLFRYNERLRLQGEQVSDAALCQAFARVDGTRGENTLTYFEFGTLAALDIMTRKEIDVALLEVGLGGRLDAVNVVDADAALITSIGIDHTEWLGKDRDAIAKEKAGIMRPGKPAVCAEADPPAALSAEAARIGALWRVLGTDFTVRRVGRGWHWQGKHSGYLDLPEPALPGSHQLANAAGVLMVLEMLRDDLRIEQTAIDSGLKSVRLAGRIQTVPGRVEQVLDVSHNAQAARALADALRHRPPPGKTYAVTGMMRDKDIESFVHELEPVVSCWFPVGLKTERAGTAQELGVAMAPLVGKERLVCCQSVADAMMRLKAEVRPGDRVLVCGSFHTVAEWVALKPDFERRGW
jgi:dihydrofolate synthase/folylpolyglutamate synthase